MTDALLSRGDAVGVVAPGFAVRPGALRAGVRQLERMGFRVVVGEHVLARDHYFAGDDAARVRDLNTMLADPAIRAVWFARGGYGAMRLLEEIDWRALARDPKPLIGYSDVTAIYAVAGRRRAPCLYGPLVVEMGDPGAYHATSLKGLLEGREVKLRLAQRQIVRAGRASGRLAGGNLAVITHLLGTRYAPDLDGAILFLEDVGEPVYRLDRMLQHLRLSGKLSNVKGVMIGSLDPVAERGWLSVRPVLDLIRETFDPLGVPLVTGVRAGHCARKRTLPIGGRARIDTARRTIRLEPRFDGVRGR